MQEIITAILTDEAARDSATVETALMEQATAVPWATETL